MTAPHSRGSSIGDRAKHWWKDYCDPIQGDAASRARLRRCDSSVDALSVIAAVSLARRLGATKTSTPGEGEKLEKALALARILAHVKAHVPETAMRIAGYRSFPGDRSPALSDEGPRLSETRFRRLLSVRGGEELAIGLIRLVTLLDGAVNITVLAQDFWWWGDRTKQRWAFDYYAAGIAAPNDSPTDEEFDA